MLTNVTFLIRISAKIISVNRQTEDVPAQSTLHNTTYGFCSVTQTASVSLHDVPSEPVDPLQLQLLHQYAVQAIFSKGVEYKLVSPWLLLF